MRKIVFVAPYFLPTTLRFLEEAAGLTGAHLGLVTQEDPRKLPDRLRSKIGSVVSVENCLDPGTLEGATRTIGEEMGKTDRIFGPLEELQVPLAEVRESLGITGMDRETARNFRDKARMKTILSDAGLPCAGHGLVGSANEAGRFVAEFGFPIVVKPPAGSGARSTFRIENESSLQDYLQTHPPSPGSPTLFEEFVVGEEHSFDSILIGGRPIWYSVSRYYPTPLEVLENPWIQWVVVLPRAVDQPKYEPIRAAAFDSLRALGLVTGLTHMEWFRRPDGSVAISEVAARPPGAQFTTLISYAHDINLYRGWAELMAFDRFDRPARPYACGAAFLRGQGQGRVKAIRGLDRVKSELGPLVVEAKLPKEGQSASGTYEGEGYVIIRHPETAVVEEALKKLVTMIRIELG